MSTLISRVAIGRVANDAPVTVHTQVPGFKENALLICIIALGLFGAVMIASASMAFADQTYNNPFYFVTRQLFFCLLYTSPSPRDLSTSRMPSSA